MIGKSGVLARSQDDRRKRHVSCEGHRNPSLVDLFYSGRHLMKKFRGMLFAIFVFAVLTIPFAGSAQREDSIKALMSSVNTLLENKGGSVRLWVAETLTASQNAGQTVYFNDRTLRLGSHWVPGDPRRGGFTDISWLSDRTEGTATGISFDATQAAVNRAMTTWNSVDCSSIPLVELNDMNIDWGYVQNLLGMGGAAGWYADYTFAGWLPGEFFDTIGGPGASDYIIGVTFTFIWVNQSGTPTDIDNNGKADVAFRETYFNNKFQWGINTNDPVDVETVVLHEAGHGLSQGHFGKLFLTDANGMFHFAPRAVMNAGYTGIQQVLTGTDSGGHCSIWASWPNR